MSFPRLGGHLLGSLFSLLLTALLGLFVYGKLKRKNEPVAKPADYSTYDGKTIDV